MQIKEVLSAPQITAVEKLAYEIWNEYYPPIIGHDQVDYMLETFQTAKAILKQIQQGCRYFILKENETLLGYMAVEKQDCCVFLSKLYVLKDARKKGYAKEALLFLKEYAKEEGLISISLTVNIHNYIAINTYQKLGFTKQGSIIQEIGNGFIMDDYKMEKPVSKQ